ncbi:MAG: hypothetical protein ACREPG_13230 [Candidatus Binatia bacterium]
MPEQSNNRSLLSGLVAIGKDFVVMLRDAGLLLMAVLLIWWPESFNKILVDAGFDEGSFAGLHWKAKVIQQDAELVKSLAEIKDWKEQNNQQIKVLTEVKSKLGSEEIKANIENLEKLNTQLVASSDKVQESVVSTIAANAGLIQKTPTSTGEVITWGVVYGSDKNLGDATYEVKTIAPKLGLANAANYYRRGYYASVATTTDRLQAEQLLSKAKQGRRMDSYVVNMSTWCPSPTDKDGYFECSNP